MPGNDACLQNRRPLVIIGAGGHAVSIANIAIALGYEIEAFLDDSKAGSKKLGVRIVGNLSSLGELSAYSFFIAVGDNGLREFIHKDLNGHGCDLDFPVLVHPSAVISHFSELGEGTAVMPGAVVGPNSRVGKFCVINTRSSIDHDCTMEDYSSLAPAAATGGNVHIGTRSAISLGAMIKHGITIGADCVVGANSYVAKDLAGSMVAYGTPAKPVRSRARGDSYL